MKKLLIRLIATAILLSPGLVFAAYNDVSLTTDTSLTIGSATVNVSGSTATLESIVVGAADFTVVLKPGSSITVDSPNLNILSVDISGSSLIVTPTCTASESSLALSAGSDSSTVIVRVNQSTLCGAAATSDSSGGGGAPVGLLGGSGGGSAPAAVVPTSTTSPTSSGVPVSYSSGLSTSQVDAILSLLSSFGADQATIDNVKLALGGKATTGTVTSAFVRNLEVGMTGDDVKALQQWLNANGYRVAESGPGSPGNETTRFGGATKAALIKFQKAKGITPAAGYFGPKTRAAIAQ